VLVCVCIYLKLEDERENCFIPYCCDVVVIIRCAWIHPGMPKATAAVAVCVHLANGCALRLHRFENDKSNDNARMECISMVQ